MQIPATFKNIGHFIAVAAKAIVKLSHNAPAALHAVEGTEGEVEALTAVVAPQAVIFEKAAYGALGVLGHIFDDANQAFDANGLNAALDAQVKADIIAAIKQFKQLPSAVATPAV